jgi:hypothetical protein
MMASNVIHIPAAASTINVLTPLPFSLAKFCLILLDPTPLPHGIRKIHAKRGSRTRAPAGALPSEYSCRL